MKTLWTQIRDAQWNALGKFGQCEDGKIGYAIIWLLGVPLPVLVVWYLLFGRG